MTKKIIKIRIAQHGLRINDIFISQTALKYYIELNEKHLIVTPLDTETTDNYISDTILQKLYECSWLM